MSRERRQIRRARRVARRRRAPEDSRQLLLDAAERVFQTENPGDVGLKEIAHEAGVSHALITHYFGTYAGLVEATLERRLAALRERVRVRLAEPGALARPDELLGILFQALEDPVHLRLMKWLAASDRPSAMHAFALQHRGLAFVARHVAAAVRPEPPRELIAAIEVALVTAAAAAIGYAVGKPALAGAIGREPGPELDADVRRTLGAMLRSYLREAIEPT